MDILENQEPLPREKTAKEKLQETLDSLNEYQEALSFIDIIQIHIDRNPEDFAAHEVWTVIRCLMYTLLVKVKRLEYISDIAEERAKYLKHYLEGKMYTSEEVAREALPLQIGNVQDILDECEKRFK